MRARSWLIPAALLAMMAAGCEGEKRVLAPTSGGAPEVLSADPGPAVPVPGAPAGEVQTRETIRKYTQNVLKLDEALAQGGVVAATTIPNTDYLSQQAAAYRTTVGRIGAMNVAHAIEIYKAEHIMDRDKPIAYDDFMTHILKKDQPDGLQLAMLPYYQEYAYDEPNQRLVVVEFPAKKEQFQQQQDKRFGRD